MSKTALKTRPTRASVSGFLSAIPDEDRRRECQALVRLMSRVTGARPRIWGGSIVGFGDFHYRYETGREGDWFLTGFSPRKRDLSIYVMAGFDRYPDLMSRLGRCGKGRSCLYVKRLDDLDLGVLAQLIRRSSADLGRRAREVRAAAKSRPAGNAGTADGRAGKTGKTGKAAKTGKKRSR